MKISVIVPIYNMEDFIEQTIKCLMEQDDTNIEFLLINDGSTDETLNIMKNICENDKRFRIFSIKNNGYGYACNLGINQSKGSFWAIYEPDDFITSDFYSTLRKIAEKYKQADVIRYNGIYRNCNKKIKKLYSWENKFTEQIIDKYTLKRFWNSHPSIFNGIYRRSFTIQKNVWFCETPSASFQDAMFMVSLFYANPSIYIINEAKYTYVIHEKQSINYINEKIDYIIASWKKELDWVLNNGFNDRSFLLYRIFIQMKGIINKVSLENKKKIIYEFKQISKNNYFIKNKIPTIKQKINYTINKII